MGTLGHQVLDEGGERLSSSPHTCPLASPADDIPEARIAIAIAITIAITVTQDPANINSLL